MYDAGVSLSRIVGAFGRRNEEWRPTCVEECIEVQRRIAKLDRDGVYAPEVYIVFAAEAMALAGPPRNLSGISSICVHSFVETLTKRLLVFGHS